MNMRCPVVGAIAAHTQQQTEAETEDFERERLAQEYTTDGIDWEDAISRTEKTMDMASDIIALVYTLPDCPAKQITVQLLQTAAASYAKDVMEQRRKAA